MNYSTGYIIGFVFIVLAIIVFGPIFTIWSLNKLFNTGIDLNFWTWLSAFWLQALVYGSTAKSK